MVDRDSRDVEVAVLRFLLCLRWPSAASCARPICSECSTSTKLCLRVRSASAVDRIRRSDASQLPETWPPYRATGPRREDPEISRFSLSITPQLVSVLLLVCADMSEQWSTAMVRDQFANLTNVDHLLSFDNHTGMEDAFVVGVWGVLTVYGLVSNVLIVIAILTSKKLSSLTSYWLIISLSVIDVSMLLVCVVHILPATALKYLAVRFRCQHF